VLLPPLIVLVALSARNGLASGSFSPLGMNPGFVFFEGNNPLSAGKSSVYPPLVEALKSDLSDQPDNPHVAYRLLAERNTGRELTNAEANQYWRRKALRFIADEPGRYLSLLGTKAYAAFHGYRRHDVATAQAFDARLGEGAVPSFPFALLAALALCGLYATSKSNRSALLVHALLATQLALMLAMYVSERQRLALLPGLIFLACGALSYLVSASRTRRATLISAAAMLTVLFSLPSFRAREDVHLWGAYQASDRAWRESLRLLEERRPRESADSAALAFARAPWLEDYLRPAELSFAPDGYAGRALAMLNADESGPSELFDRAQLMIAAGRYGDAETVLRSLIERGERFDRGQIHSSDPGFFLARSLAAQGRRREAVDELRRALSAHPGDPFVLAELAALTGDARYQQLIVRYYGETEAHFLIGMAQIEHGEPSLRNMAETVRRVPELWRARIYLAAALGSEGDLDSAARVYREATERKQTPAMLEERIVPIFESAARASPADWAAHFEYGLVLRQFGRFDEALEALHAALSLEPRPEIEAAIAEVGRMRALTASR
jgi:Flp pilus assembly protein TadD